MSSSNLIRWSGLAAALGGALVLISDLLSLTVTSGTQEHGDYSAGQDRAEREVRVGGVTVDGRNDEREQ